MYDPILEVYSNESSYSESIYIYIQFRIPNSSTQFHKGFTKASELGSSYIALV